MVRLGANKNAAGETVIKDLKPLTITKIGKDGNDNDESGGVGDCSAASDSEGEPRKRMPVMKRKQTPSSKTEGVSGVSGREEEEGGVFSDASSSSSDGDLKMPPQKMRRGHE